MFITKASRHDKTDIEEFLKSEGPWEKFDVNRGTAFVAREGSIVGHARLIEIDPTTLVVEEVLVRGDKRRQGIGTRVMEAAMNNKGGKLFLCCHSEHISFYGKLGFAEVPFEELPDEVQAYHRNEGDYPTAEGHEHHFMTAR
jgi:N-acetylglutamate synthase-like GNAT family acetyltransferase